VIAGWPRAADLRREIAYSLLSIAVFAGLSLGIVALIWSGHFVIYRDPARYGWTWLLLSLPLMLVFHDTYFYWTHRLPHTRWLFRRFHGVHHRSRNPSPWAAYAFHPVEALINGLVTPLILWAVPVHGGVLLLSRCTRSFATPTATCPSRSRAAFARHGLGRHLTTTTHHHLHHEGGRGNFGLWFTWWDRCCGTDGPTIWRVSRPPRAAREPLRLTAPGPGSSISCGARWPPLPRL
jgi:sterol desaturase/sphingolipid hydroxylase (fatty acid hydroxylase superfamily)